MKVGFFLRDDPTRGLWRDMETLEWVLRSPPFPFKDPLETSRFLVERIEDTPTPAYTKWAAEQDVVVFFESLLPNLVEATQARTVLIPNIEWASYKGSTAAFCEHAARVDEVWTKTDVADRALRRAGLRNLWRVPWSIPDPVRCEPHPKDPEEPLRVFFCAGHGGWQGRRNAKVVAEAWKRLRTMGVHARLTVTTVSPKVAEHFRGLPGVHLHEKFLPRRDLQRKYAEADLFLFPSRWEGFGIPLLEALHAGTPVIVPNCAPMNELVETEHNGVLLPNIDRGHLGLSPTCDVDPEDLARAMRFVLTDDLARRRMTCPEPGALLARQHAFRVAVFSSLHQHVPEVYVHVPPRGNALEERSEVFVADVVKECGYTLQPAPTPTTDMVLVGKIPAQTMRELQASAPDAHFVCWHFDYVPGNNNRESWWKEVKWIAHYCFDPDGQAGWSAQVLPGARSWSVRGRGRRAFGWRTPEEAAESKVVLFQGTYLSNDRVRWLKFVEDRLPEGWQLVIQGPSPSGAPRAFRDSSRYVLRPGAFGPRGRDDARNAARVLSLNISDDSGRNGYTSNRLFCLAEAGADIVAAPIFKGLQLFGEDAVEWGLDKIGENLDTHRAEKRRRAEETYWRRHTWQHRMVDILGRIHPPTVALKASPPEGEVTLHIEHLAPDHIYRVQRAEGRFYEQEMLDRLVFGFYYRLGRAWWDRHDTVIYDVGAHVGNHTLYLAVMTGCHVLAFEPHPKTYWQLDTNVTRNPEVRGYVDTFPLLIGDGDRAALAEALHRDNTGATRYTLSPSGAPTTKLDDIEASVRPWLIKIDVEGMEHAVLRGAKNVLAQRPVLAIEGDREKLLRELLPLGYQLHETFDRGTPTHIFEPAGIDDFFDL